MKTKIILIAVVLMGLMSIALTSFAAPATQEIRPNWTVVSIDPASSQTQAEQPSQPIFRTGVKGYIDERNGKWYAGDPPSKVEASKSGGIQVQQPQVAAVTSKPKCMGIFIPSGVLAAMAGVARLVLRKAHG